MGYWEIIDAATPVMRCEYTFGAGGSATCLAFGLGGKKLAIISPPGGRSVDAIYEALDAHGEVRAIIGPCGFHHLGMRPAHRRYPQATLYAAPQAAKRIQRKQKGLPDLLPLSKLQAQLPEHIEVFVPPHLRGTDTIVRIHTDSGPIWYINDIIMNLPHLPKNPILRFLMWALGFRKGLSVNRFGCRFVMKVERPAFATWLQAELTDHPPHILVPGHGPAIREAELLSRLPEIIARELGDPKKHPPADDRS